MAAVPCSEAAAGLCLVSNLQLSIAAQVDPHQPYENQAAEFFLSG